MNLKKLLLFIASLSCHFLFLGQCPTNLGSVLTTQAGVNQFPVNYPNCINITGNLILDQAANTSDPIISLAPLAQVQTIAGQFRIKDCDQLTSFAGLNSLVSIGELNLVNINMTNLNDFALVSIGAIGVFSCDNLSDLSIFSGVTTLGKLSMKSCPLITSLTSFSSLQTINSEQLNISEMQGLTSLSGLENLSSITDRVFIKDNDNLESLDGLAGLTTIDEDLSISNNPSLQNISGLSNLTSLKTISISNNDLLTSLDGLQNIDGSGLTFLNLGGNPLLSECEVQSVCDYLDNPGVTIVGSNATGCNTVAEVQAACSALPVEMTTFTVKPMDIQATQLSWTTSTESNNRGWTIQRSADGQLWEDIAFVEGRGNTTTTIAYDYVDDKTQQGRNYYRLAQEDFDGAITNSAIKEIYFGFKDIVIYPNPTKGDVNIVIPEVPVSSSGIVEVLNELGQVVQLRVFESSKVRMDIDGLPNGIYAIHVTIGAHTQTYRIIKN